MNPSAPWVTTPETEKVKGHVGNDSSLHKFCRILTNLILTVSTAREMAQKSRFNCIFTPR